MGATRLQLEIYSHAPNFRSKFRVKNFTTEYMFCDFVNRFLYMSVTIIKTSVKCYRVIFYKSRLGIDNQAVYKSFRSIADLCVYLDTIALAK